MYKTMITPRGPYTFIQYTYTPDLLTLTYLSAAGKAISINILAVTQLSSYIFIFIHKLEVLINSFFTLLKLYSDKMLEVCRIVSFGTETNNARDRRRNDDKVK
jgi:hypothetical protein